MGLVMPVTSLDMAKVAATLIGQEDLDASHIYNSKRMTATLEER